MYIVFLLVVLQLFPKAISIYSAGPAASSPIVDNNLTQGSQENISLFNSRIHMNIFFSFLFFIFNWAGYEKARYGRSVMASGRRKEKRPSF